MISTVNCVLINEIKFLAIPVLINSCILFKLRVVIEDMEVEEANATNSNPTITHPVAIMMSAI